MFNCVRMHKFSTFSQLLNSEYCELNILFFLISFNHFILLPSKQTIHTIPQGRLSYLLQDLCSGPLPKQVLVSFVAHDSFNGTLKKNPFIFENLDIRSLVFKINGENR